MELATEAAPRLARFLDSARRWRDRGIVFVPVRHNSPGCAAALSSLLDELKPSRVLIEGPREYGALLPALNSADTVPPVAVLSVSQGSAAFYPLAPFSPEWVALRWGGEHGAVVDFIDRSYSEPDTDPLPPAQGPDRTLDDGQLHTLQREQHLAHSASIAALAQALGCRDHDEVWEHLFEVRSAAQTLEWRQFFDDVAAWCALARLDYGQDLLDRDDTLNREAVMCALINRHVAAHADDLDPERGPIVVVTGGFHTLGLVEALDGTEHGKWITSKEPGNLDPDFESWLIRYDYERLDGLRGYGAGMPAPGYWQRSWDAQNAGVSVRDFTAAVVLEVTVEARKVGELISTPLVQAAAEQALRLMDLRGRSWPGRTDILDAMLSTFVKDENGFPSELSAAISRIFGGTRLGQVPDGLAAPPLVAEARARAKALKFSVESSEVKRVSLDTARKPRHVERREFLAKMRFLGVGFARHTGGADVVTGHALGQFFEEWEYAWNPMVEASLIELSGTAPTIDLAVSRTITKKLEALTEPDPGRTVPLASGIAQLLCEVAAMGSRELIPVLRDQLASVYARDVHVGSIVRSIHSLLNVVESSGRLQLSDHATSLLAVADQGLATVAFQIPVAVRVAQDEQADLCDSLSDLYSAVKRRERLAIPHPDDLTHPADQKHGPDGANSADLTDPADGANSADGANAANLANSEDIANSSDLTITHSVRRALERAAHDHETPPRIRGALLGLMYVDGRLDLERLNQILAAHLSPQAEPTAVSALMLGLMSSSPDVILRTPDTLELLDNRLATFDDQAFMGVLPDLREAFGQLKPTETHKLATAISGLTGGSAADLDAVLSVDPVLVARGLRIDNALRAGLERDGLARFLAVPAPSDRKGTPHA